ncbi:MAG: site-specific integrase [Xanthobacteraceae bacterium]
MRIYYRRKGFRKARLEGTPWTPEFMAAYDAAKKIAAPAQGVLARPTLPNTWSWLCLRYFAECTDYKLLDPRTQHVRRQILEATFDEPIRRDTDKRFADIPLARMDGNAIEVLRDRKLSTPESANARVKAIRQVFKWGVSKGHAPSNPAREVSYFKSSSEGFHTWTLEEVQQFEEHHPIGTKARLAFALLLYTGQRRSDVIRFGKQHAKHGALTFTQYKGRNRKPHKLTLPILPVLQKIIDGSPCGDLTFLVNEFGRAFTDAGFGNKFRDWCDQADLPHCSAHGLRKAGATIAANNGATARQLMAIFGWDTIKQAEQYTRKADQKLLAEAAMHLLEKR